MFILRDDTIIYHGRTVEVITAEKRISAFQAMYRSSARLAATVVAGGFTSPTAVRATGRTFRLLCVNPETIHEARQKGILQ